MKQSKVALVYDRVNKWGGAERVLLALNEMFPEAPLYTSVYSPTGAPWARKFKKIETSYLQKIPGASTNHEYLAAFMPLAFESFNLSRFDLVISVSSEAAKGVLTPNTTRHLSYCLTPTRYLWNGYNSYFKNSLLKKISAPVVSYLKSWDKVAAHRSDLMLGISNETKGRIKKFYERDVDIIFPPVDTKFFSNGTRHREDYYLLVSRLVSYKKIELAIKAFNRLGYPLLIIGTGRLFGKLKKMAKPNIVFLGQVSDQELRRYYQSAKALVFPQREDFGIVPVEAQAAGTPVIAYAKGGALDTVIDGKTGILFEKQTTESLVGSVMSFQKHTFDPKLIKKNAETFSKARFAEGFATILNRL